MTTSDSERVLILAPRGRDAPIAARVLLEAGIASQACDDVSHLCREIDAGAGVVLVTTEALPAPRSGRSWRRWSGSPRGRSSPCWSSPRPASTARCLLLGPIEARAHITILDRPVRVKSLISATRSALLSRRRQYQLRNLMEELEGRVHERDKFLAILGHELLKPLAAILLASQMVDAKDGRLDGEHAAMIERQSRHLTRLVDDLLDLLAGDGGEDRAPAAGHRPQPHRRAVAGVAPQRREDAGRRAAFSPGSGPFLVDGDPIRLEQIVVNLLTNAVKYTLPGGRADVVVDGDGGQVRLQVKDTGVGIDAERISSIFGLFMQAENAIGRAQGGMGIGLSLVRSLVELHGGAVTVESGGIGQGSEFTVRLPRVEAGVAGAAAKAAALGPEEPAKLTIVLIEDNSDVRTLMQNKLRKLGHAVEGFRDGEDGAVEIAARLPDLAIVDLGLPGIDGYEVANRVRKEIGHRVYLVALSGFGQPEDKRRALEAGFDEHITKPADVKALKELLGRVGARDEARQMSS